MRNRKTHLQQVGFDTTAANAQLNALWTIWHKDPRQPYTREVCKFFSKVLHNQTIAEPASYTVAFQNLTFKKLVEACDIVLASNEVFSLEDTEMLAELLVQRGWWRNLLQAGREQLLASILIDATNIDSPEEIKQSAVVVAQTWGGKPLQNEGATTVQQAMAAYLYGEAWSVLYCEDMTVGFEYIYDTISDTQPVLEITKQRHTDNNVNATSLPEDLANF